MHGMLCRQKTKAKSDNPWDTLNCVRPSGLGATHMAVSGLLEHLDGPQRATNTPFTSSATSSHFPSTNEPSP